MKRLAFTVCFLSATLLHAAQAQNNRPTLAQALAVPGTVHVVGKTDGTFDAFSASQLASLPAHAKASAAPGSPTMGSCGTNPSFTGDNTEGLINVGTGIVTSCVIDLKVSLTRCFVSASSAIALGWSVSGTTLTIAMGVSLGAGKLAYRCS